MKQTIKTLYKVHTLPLLSNFSLTLPLSLSKRQRDKSHSPSLFSLFSPFLLSISSSSL